MKKELDKIRTELATLEKQKPLVYKDLFMVGGIFNGSEIEFTPEQKQAFHRIAEHLGFLEE